MRNIIEWAEGGAVRPVRARPSGASRKADASGDAEAGPGPQDGGAGLSPPLLVQYGQILWRRKWPMLAVFAASLALALLVTLALPQNYTARTQLEINREQKQITNVEGLQSRDAGRDLEFYATQYELLETRPVAQRVAADLQLAQTPAFFAAHGIDPADELPAGLSGSAREAALEALAVDTLLEHVAIEPVRLSRLVDIAYTSRSAELSQRVADGWALAFTRISMDREFASTAQARAFLEERLEVLRQRLEVSEREAVNFAADRGIVAFASSRDEDGRTQPARTLAETNLEALSQLLNEAIAERVAAQSRLRASGETTPEALSSGVLAALREQRARADAEYRRLLVQFEPGYPQLQALMQQIESLDAAIAAEVSRISGTRAAAFRQAAAREAQLRQQVAAARALLGEQQRAGIQHTIFQREADTNRQLYDALLQRYKEIGVAGNVGASNISVVEPAVRPEHPSSPDLLLNLALGLLAGVVLAALTGLALEELDETLRDPAQLGEVLGLVPLGSTPLVEGGEVLAELADPKSPLYEAYFSIRSSLAFSTSQGFPKVLAVTSTRPGEGKSSTALALAMIQGRTGARVLLVDADMRLPSVHHLLGCDNGAGLANLLAGAQDWRGMVRPSGFDNVSALLSGPHPPNAAELLSGARFEALLDELAAQFDHVIVDAPPVLGLSDAPLIAGAVDGVVLCVQSQGVPRRGIRGSIERLRQARARLHGAVLTKVPLAQAGYGYAYQYEYGASAKRAPDTAKAA